MKRTASMAAPMLALLACAAPVAASAGEYDRGIFRSIFSSPPAAAPQQLPVIRRHRSDELRAGRKEKTIETQPVVPAGPLHIIVSINKQRVTLFANGRPVTTANISTGAPGHPTPMGVFTVIEKDRHHFSNLYGDAPMPYMQRITWSGAALHEGPLPGRPASHGCVRLTPNFAQLLWKTTKIGARVIVTKDEVAPVEIDLPNLFARPKIAQALDAAVTPPPAPARVKTADATGLVLVKVAQASAIAPVSTPAANASSPEQATKLDLVDKVERAAAEVAAAGTSAAGPAAARRDIPTATVVLAPPPTAIEPPSVVLPASPPLPVSRREAMRSGQPISVFVSRKQGKLYVRQKWIPLFEVPVTIANPDAPLGTHIFTAMEGVDEAMRWTVVSIPSGFKQGRHKVEEPRRTRQAAYHDVAPETALPVPGAREALNRITFPPEAAARIADLMKPGSALIISDNRLSDETGEYTDFIVLTP